MSFNLPSKRRKLNPTNAATAIDSQRVVRSTERSISPPLRNRRRFEAHDAREHVTSQRPTAPQPKAASIPSTREKSRTGLKASQNDARYLHSPVRLTRIKDLAPHQNVDAVGLRDLLGDPLIEECWCFNFLHDIPFTMDHFDPDIRGHVKLKIIHGFWRKDDDRRISLMESASHYPNVTLIPAYLPHPYGTHHTKMLILFRHDASAQVIIHTANMIPRDWGNMTQAVWQSPSLPLQSEETQFESVPRPHPLGCGERFKVDIMRYLSAYDKRLNTLTARLGKHNFASVRAAFIGSTPSKQNPNTSQPALHTSYGWLGVKEILSHIPTRTNTQKKRPNIIIQISSIATLGPNPTWLENFQSALSATKSTNIPHAILPSSFFSPASKLSLGAVSTKGNSRPPKFNIMFPTPNEIRASLDGYASGGSIHTKIQSSAQQKQLEYLRPLLCCWRSQSLSTSSTDSPPLPTNQSGKRIAHRGPAAPHIKTYIRFSDEQQRSIDWAMVTSANLSKQAWGGVVSEKGEVWIQSWECGVVVWPELFRDVEGEKEEEQVTMVPVFGKDTPGPEDVGEEETSWVFISKTRSNVDESETDDETEDETEDEGEYENDVNSTSPIRKNVTNTNTTNTTNTNEESETEPETEPEGEDEDEQRSKPPLQNKSEPNTLPPKQQKPRKTTIIGFRMPYDLPLTPYAAHDVPWCASMPHAEPDWKGMSWEGG